MRRPIGLVLILMTLACIARWVIAPLDALRDDPGVPSPGIAAKEPMPGTSESGAEDASQNELEPSAERVPANPQASILAGHIALPSGLPADERVELVLESFEPQNEREAGMAEYIEGLGWKEVGRTSPDAAGDFRLQLPSKESRLRVRLEARYLYVPETREIENPAELLVLEPILGGAIRLRLLPREGEALEPALLVGKELNLGRRRSQAEKRAGPEGPRRLLRIRPDLEVHAEGLVSGALYWLDGSLDPFPWLSVDAVPVEAGVLREVEVQLPDSSVFACRIVDASGTPVAGAEIQVTTEQLTQGARWWDQESVSSDASGDALIHVLDSQSSSIWVKHEDFLSKVVQLAGLGLNTEDRPFEVVLDRGFSVTVAVRLADGRYVEGANVSCMPLREGRQCGPVRARRTDAHGRVEFSGLEETEQRAFARARLASGVENRSSDRVVTVSQTDEGSEWQAEPRNVIAGAGAHDLLLVAAPGVAGIVVDRKGAPVPRFRIAADQGEAGSPEFHPLPESIRSDQEGDFRSADGHFEWAELPIGRWRLIARAEGFLDSAPIEIELPRQTEPLRFVLDRSVSMSGLVLDPSGLPVGDAAVYWSWVTPAERDSRRELKTDSAGSFRVEGIVSGRLEMFATAKGYATSAHELVDLAPGESRTGIELRLEVGGRFVLRTFDRAGRPERLGWGQLERFSDDAIVELHDSHERVGELEVGPIRAGAYRLRVRMREIGYQEAAVEIVEGETVTLELGGPSAESVHVRGRLTCAGAPVPGAHMEVSADPTRVTLGRGPTREDGSYEIDLESGGPVVFRIVRPEIGEVFHARDLPAAGECVLDFELPSGGIRGSLQRADGGELRSEARLLVSANQPGGLDWSGRRIEIRISGAGAWACEHLPAGTYSVLASSGPEGGESSIHARRDGIVVRDGEITEGIALVVGPLGAIEGALRRADDRPPSDGRVFARDETGRLIHPIGAAVGVGGRFRLQGLPEGRLFLEAIGEGAALPEPIPCDVIAGETRSLDLVLAPATIVQLRLEGVAGSLEGVRLSLRDPHGWERASSAVVSRSDRYSRRLGPLRPGRWTLALTLASGQSSTQTFDLTGEPERSIVVDLGSH